MRLAVRRWLVAASLVLALVAAIWWYYRKWHVYHGYTPRPFSREAWASADPDTRGHMLNDLLRKHPMEGRMAEEVQALLGAPDDGGEWGLRYRVGYLGFNRRAPMVYSYTLHVNLDGRGRVVRVYTDD